jgi:hypothetical protein
MTSSARASIVGGTSSPSALCGFEVDDEIKFGGLLNGDVSGIGSAEKPYQPSRQLV